MANIFAIEPDIPSARKSTATAPTWITSKPARSAVSCRARAFPSSPESICPSSVSAAKSTSSWMPKNRFTLPAAARRRMWCHLARKSKAARVPSVAGPKRIDQMSHPKIRSLAAQVAADLQETTNIAGEYGLDVGSDYVLRLALTQALGHLRFGEV